ncbi:MULTISPECIES: transporter substrate-binding domain-containing protein [unclassified Shinella]|uniref:transporter substrate-binding domain-containing protein n=1 Tax=unclassified Shinella TaxID=2643062 RepID=UPI00225C52F5|nr:MULTISPECIES: transporter substrate-binding domain-containing protein [unclassified Shinella]MCO5136407.1 transporter substrate-binding domain-containing protein [Shinella sp.]MDC7253918.1 transporter substrate-binding domain-containing protein [Shinella sp. YE25]CAI0336573.1 PBPb domain-containing protein [Rhizobiaceae bacterium]CAK7255106.1 polar amino acid transport system substrate-binding protein [Shinella sp. WSC3-e]
MFCNLLKYLQRPLVKLGIAAIALACLMPGLSPTEASAGTLEDIAARGKLIVGIQAENPPWGFIDEKGENAGYDADVARLMGEALKVPVEFVRVTTPNRIAQLQTGRVDVLIAVLGMYPDRAEVVQFSKPYSTLRNIVIAPKSMEIKDFPDLAGMNVGVCRGCNQDKILTENVPSDTTMQRFDDDAATAQALLSGQVTVIGGNNTYIANINKVKPDNDYEQKFVLTTQWTGMGLRKGDPEFLAWTNDFIDGIIKDGRLNEVSQRWLQEDLPEFPAKLDGIPF